MIIGMDQNVSLLASVIGPCPDCSNGLLEAVSDGELTNFVCPVCGSCWHPELDWVSRVDPAACPGCPSEAVCHAAHRPYGAVLSPRS